MSISVDSGDNSHKYLRSLLFITICRLEKVILKVDSNVDKIKRETTCPHRTLRAVDNTEFIHSKSQLWVIMLRTCENLDFTRKITVSTETNKNSLCKCTSCIQLTKPLLFRYGSERAMNTKKNEIRRNRTVTAGSIIDTVLVRYKLFDGVFLSKIAAEKETIFGTHFASHLTPIEYRNGWLKLKFDNDAWRHEAELSQNELLKRLEEYAPGKIRKIFFL